MIEHNSIMKNRAKHPVNITPITAKIYRNTVYIIYPPPYVDKDNYLDPVCPNPPRSTPDISSTSLNEIAG